MKSMQTQLILDALEQALWSRGPKGVIPTVIAAVSMCLSVIQATVEAGFSASVGSVGDSYDNALAETIKPL